MKSVTIDAAVDKNLIKEESSVLDSEQHAEPSMIKRISRALSNKSLKKIAFADRLASTLVEGDIVMFQGKRMHDGLIRCCTRSEFNHVAMIVEVDGELEMFEATAMGVGQVPLEFYINSFYWSHMSGLFHKVPHTVQTRVLSAAQPCLHTRDDARVLIMSSDCTIRWWCASSFAMGGVV